MKSKLRMGVSTGGPTIIVIFVILCLATLGTLSLVTANADLRLTEKTAAYATDYYRADSLCEEFLADVDTILIENTRQNATTPLLTALSDGLTRQEFAGVVEQDDGSLLVNFVTDMNENQLLHIALQVFSGRQFGTSKPYTIQAWNVENKQYWNYEEHQIIIDGALPE